jgi:hypothetical protein
MSESLQGLFVMLAFWLIVFGWGAFITSPLWWGAFKADWKAWRRRHG